MVVGGGWKAVRSVLRYSSRIGPFKLLQTLRSKNACKACAFGTGGQNGGFWNEARHGIEICNKNIQAHLSDIRPAIPVPLFLQKSIADLSQLSGKQLEDLGRLTMPLYKAAGDSHYRPMDYDEALQICADRLRKTSPERSFFYASGRSSNEAAFLLQLLARLYGTNNVNNCSYYCHQASGVALGETIGTGTATVQYGDIEKADLIFVFGANPASNHPRFVKTLIHLRRRGGTVVVVNPAKEPGMVRFASPSDWRSMMKGGEKIASEYVQPHLGGDLAFIQGVAKAVLEQGGQNREFIENHTAGFYGFAQTLSQFSWEEIERSSGVERKIIEKIADIYCRSQNCIFTWSMGLTHHTHGVHTIQALVSLALLRGMIGKPGAGLLPLRGHSNIQGTGSMGFTPELKKAIEVKLEQTLGHTLPKQRGLDTMACMHAAANQEIDVAIMLGGNLLASNPHTAFATAALNKIPFKCFFSPTINMSHVHGVEQEVVIFPVRTRDEEQQGTTQESMFNFVRLSDGGINRFAQLRSEVELICRLGELLIDRARLDFSIFRSHEKIRKMIGDVIPGFGKITDIDQSKEEFHIEGRTLHTPVFNTPDKKGHFFAHPLPVREEGVFYLTSVRSEGQFNSIIYHEYDTYREQTDRWVVLMNPTDMARQGWKPDQKVDLVTPVGKMSGVKVKPFEIRPGNLMTYYPEANVLISNHVDPHSKTPGFKSLPVFVIPAV
ncbi:histidine kinase [Saccharophagus sp. K07]|uniref:FdhF/YdeP family oxidoreductase n=1 Tax=Saccharophagus sp. K07 TaxID=2283636 RepID=UPI0016522105|nr:FdhF/YdeP family oxidoreductase [Saccharophagus sp. K07]MBC6905806.1 histidine kinase [Saccharophagus sp. K07]